MLGRLGGKLANGLLDRALKARQLLRSILHRRPNNPGQTADGEKPDPFGDQLRCGESPADGTKRAGQALEVARLDVAQEFQREMELLPRGPAHPGARNGRAQLGLRPLQLGFDCLGHSEGNEQTKPVGAPIRHRTGRACRG